MSFYPIFIPGGGGGGGGGPQFILAYIAGVGLFAGLLEILTRPAFHADIIKYGNCATIWPHYRNYPHIQRTTINNTECLEAKGYKVQIGATAFGERLPRTIYISSKDDIKSDLSIEELLADCKKCNTHMDIDYEYDGLFTCKMHDATKRLNWSSCRVRRELK